MPQKKESEYVEISFSKFLIPVAIIIAGGLIALAVFLGGNESEEVKGDTDSTSEAVFDDPNIKEASITINLNEGAYLGNLETAKYAIVEFSDYQCSFCSRHASETLPKIKDSLLNEELAYFFREVSLYPPQSMSLSLLGQCIFENEGLENYLNYHSQAYGFSFEKDNELLEKVKINAETKKCFDEREYEKRVESNWLLGQGSGIQGVPGFVFGEIKEDGLIEGYLIPGAFPYETFEEVYEALKE
jgi:protein-disulfide isomerase